VVRELGSEELTAIIVDDPAAAGQLRHYLGVWQSGRESLVQLHDAPESLFSAFGVETDWQRLLAPRVWLKSGGYLWFERTLALTAIDVNTGRFIGCRNPADTLLTTNLEAAQVIAAQLRLRNLSGLMVVDFIDMEAPAHRELVYQTLVAALARDRARTTVLPVSGLGLVEMTRQRLGPSLEEVLTEACPACGGRGRVAALRVAAGELLRRLREEAREFPGCRLTVTAHPDLLALIQTEESEYLQQLTKNHPVSLSFIAAAAEARERFTLTRELPAASKKG
jgi:ribonuclease G